MNAAPRPIPDLMEFAKRQLTNPNNAEFSTISTRGVRVDFLEECHFRVGAYVDAQNVFGGTVRTRYAVDIEADPRDGGYFAENFVWLR